MKERPILISGDMVRAILDGRKTQTRRAQGLAFLNKGPNAWRVVRPLERIEAVYPSGTNEFPGAQPGDWLALKDPRGITDDGYLILGCPYGVVGDRLWVRESIGEFAFSQTLFLQGVTGATYQADLSPVMGKGPMGQYVNGRALLEWKWKRRILSARFMPRWASRITLEVTDVRVQRLQAITPGECVAEGVSSLEYVEPWEAVLWYRQVWDGLNAKRGYSWESNPWVWAITFKVVLP